MMKKENKLSGFAEKFLFAIAVLLTLGASDVRAEQLIYGKYFGTIQMEGQAEAIAVTLDAFVVQIDNPTVYPAMEVIVRANLGGFSSSEYVGYHFYDPTFNFEKSLLYLNDSKSELSATLQVSSTESETILEGPVTHRLSNAKGRMRVELKFFGEAPVMPVAPLLPVLKGEYTGTCGSDKAILQIETGRGLGADAPGNALSDYTITGRMGYTNGPLCSPDETNKFCSLYPYSTGTYSPFTNKLTMQGPRGTIDCTKKGNDFHCKVAGYNKKGSCVLRKKPEPATAPVVFSSNLALEVPPDLKLPLPAPLPPHNEELVNSLSGDFFGFLHYENQDKYQLIEMGVVSTTSTENPHIENQVMVQPTVLLRAGSSWDSPGVTITYPQRVFWMSQGFAFQDADNNYLIVIEEWRKGYVKGVLYSRTFGRVGKFEMQKGARPKILAGMDLIPDPSGDYQGPKDGPQRRRDLWSLTVEFPGQLLEPEQSVASLLGRYSGVGLMEEFSASSFDFNTGALSFLIKREQGDRLVIGAKTSNGNLKLLWPTGPVLGAPMYGYAANSYAPKGSAQKSKPQKNKPSKGK